MKLTYYDEDDILVMKLSDMPIDYAIETNWVIVHFDQADRPVRIEILDANRFFKEEKKAVPQSILHQYFASPSSPFMLNDK